MMRTQTTVLGKNQTEEKIQKLLKIRTSYLGKNDPRTVLPRKFLTNVQIYHAVIISNNRYV
jgi:hypothetical protein